MQLTRASTTATLARPTRSRTVKVVAWKGDNAGPFSGLLRMFAPNSSINTKDSFPEGTGYKGNTTKKTRRPFKDNYVARKVTKAEVEAEEKARPEGILGYLSAAAERVVGHQFKGDATEPDWSKLGQRSIKGSISRKSDGHAKK